MPAQEGWTPKNSICRPLAQALFDLYHAPDEQFNEIYSWRANAESVFSTIEQLYSKAIRARGRYGRDLADSQVPLSIEIEMLAKCVAHNVTRLVYLESELEQMVSFTECRSLVPISNKHLRKGRSLLVVPEAA